MGGPTPEVERVARAEGDVVRSALVPMLGALGAGAIAIQLGWDRAVATVEELTRQSLRGGAGEPGVMLLHQLVIVAGMAAVMVRRVTTLHPFANAGWPGRFEDLHRPGMVVIVLLFASAVATIRPSAPDQQQTPAASAEVRADA